MMNNKRTLKANDIEKLLALLNNVRTTANEVEGLHLDDWLYDALYRPLYVRIVSSGGTVPKSEPIVLGGVSAAPVNVEHEKLVA